MSYLITASDGTSAVWSLDVLRENASKLAPSGDVVVVETPDKAFDLIIDVTPIQDSAYQVLREADGTSLSTDGTLDQAMLVAAWARALLPVNLGAQLWIVDQAYTHRAIVPFGAGAGQVAADWAEID